MKFQQKCLGKMDDVSKTQGRTILYVSHNMNTIRQLCTRCLVLNHGKLIFDGDVEEAIAIYMGEIDVSKKVIDLREKSRGMFVRDGTIHINKIEILNADSGIFDYEQDIELKIDYSAKKGISNFSFRFLIFHAGSDAVGMNMSPPVISCVKGDNSTKVRFNLKGLVPGKYSARLVAYSTNGLGGTLCHDAIEEAVVFQITEEKNSPGLPWNSKYWGSICFTDVEVLK